MSINTFKTFLEQFIWENRYVSRLHREFDSDKLKYINIKCTITVEMEVLSVRKQWIEVKGPTRNNVRWRVFVDALCSELLYG